MLLFSPMTSLSFFRPLLSRIPLLLQLGSESSKERAHGIRPPIAAACLGKKSTGERRGGFLLSSLKNLMDKATEATGDGSDGNA